MKQLMHKMSRDIRNVAVISVALLLFVGNASAQLTVTKNKDVTCHGQTDGSASASAIGGTPPHSYLWSNGETSSTANALPAGTHSVTVTDAHQCEVTGSVTITEPPELSISISGGPATVKHCSNEAPPSLTLSASASGGVPPYTYNWSGGSITVSSSGSYTATVRDQKNCFKSATVSVLFIPVLCSQDPNDISGPQGYGDDHWVTTTDAMPFTIRYENDPVFATAAAQKVTVTMPVDSNFNLYSFRLSDFGFGDFVFSVPNNTTYYTRRLDVRDSLGIFVDVLAGLNVTTREAFWTFESVDPATGLPPQDAHLGYLPVNDTVTHRGEGFVNFTILPMTTVSSGDSILAEASIVFDVNSPIETNVWKNTIDPLPPTTLVNPITAVQDSAAFSVTFTAADNADGSGMKHVELFVSRDNEPYISYGQYAPDSGAVFHGSAGHYTFYSIGTDNAGNKEALKSLPEAQVIILDSLQFLIGGIITYANNAGTPLVGLKLSLNKILELNIDSAFTDSLGAYSFDNVSRGTYYIKTTSNHAWGGVNATDALIVSKYTVGLDSLTGVAWKAGDVNASGSVNSTDALEIKKRVIGVTNSFEAGNWTFDVDTLQVVNDTLDQSDFTGLAMGDVNASFVNPNARLSNNLSLVREGVLNAPTGLPFELPIYVETPVDVAAITLFLEYNPTLVDVLGVRTSHNPVMFNASNRQIRCAWDSISPVSAGPNDPLLYLIIRANQSIDLDQVLPFNLIEGSELADRDAIPFSNLTLRVPTLNFSPGEFDFYPNYPNPFKESTTLRYDLAEYGRVSIQLLNTVGQVVATLIDEPQEPGRYEFIIDGTRLAVGMYQCRMVVRSDTNSFTKTIKMIHYRD